MALLKKIIHTVCEGYYQIEKWYVILATSAVGLLITAEIIMRMLGFQGIRWLNEVSCYMLITVSLIGSSMAVRENGHMVMDVLYTKLKPRPAYVIKAITYLFCGVFYVWLSTYAYQWMLKLKMMGKTWDSINFPFWYIWVFVVFSLATMGLRYFVQTWKCIQNFRKHTEEFSEMNTQEM